MWCKEKKRSILLLVSVIVLSMAIELRVSGQTPSRDFYVKMLVSMDNDAIAFYAANLTFGPKAVNELREAGWILKIQFPKWASPKLVFSTDMPCLLMPDGRVIRLKLEKDTYYDYLVAEIPSVESDSFNLTLKIGLVQRDAISGSTVGFKLPILTGFNIIPEYVNFTFRTSGRIESYTQYLLNFNPIFENNTVVGLWNLYIRPNAVGNLTGSVFFSKSFDKCVVERLLREIIITEQLQVLVKDSLRIRYIGSGKALEILEVKVPTNISKSVKANDALGSLYTYAYSFTGSNTSTVSVYSRYMLDPNWEYEVVVEYSVPFKNVTKHIEGNNVTILLNDMADYGDIVNNYSLSVKTASRRDWKITVGSTTFEIKKGDAFTYNVTNAMPPVLVQSLSITFTPFQIEVGRSISIILGLLTLAIFLVTDLFRERKELSVEEVEEKKEVKSLVEKITEALNEKIDYESRLEEVKVRSALGKISSKEKTVIEEYGRRIAGAEKKIVKTIEQISLKNPRIGEEVKKNYDIFEEINNDLKKMLENTIEKFKSGRITRSVFENLSGKYLKDNRKRRETAAEDVYKSLERLGP